jgi:hypothetical protein
VTLLNPFADNYSKPDKPQHRGGLVHSEPWLQERDHSGYCTLLADRFYYFGKEPFALPSHLQSLVKRNQGHYRRTNDNEIAAFEAWLLQQGFEHNKVYADPQAPVWQQIERFQKSLGECRPNSCSSRPLLRISARRLSA